MSTDYILEIEQWKNYLEEKMNLKVLVTVSFTD